MIIVLKEKLINCKPHLHDMYMEGTVSQIKCFQDFKVVGII